MTNHSPSSSFSFRVSSLISFAKYPLYSCRIVVGNKSQDVWKNRRTIIVYTGPKISWKKKCSWFFPGPFARLGGPRVVSLSTSRASAMAAAWRNSRRMASGRGLVAGKTDWFKDLSRYLNMTVYYSSSIVGSWKSHWWIWWFQWLSISWNLPPYTL